MKNRKRRFRPSQPAEVIEADLDSFLYSSTSVTSYHSHHSRSSISSMSSMPPRETKWEDIIPDSVETILALREKGFKHPLPLQEKIISRLIRRDGRSYLFNTPPQSGKQIAYLTAAACLFDANDEQPQFIFISPTDDSVDKAASIFNELTKYKTINMHLVQPLKPSRQVVFGTPSSISSLLNARSSNKYNSKSKSRSKSNSNSKSKTENENVVSLKSLKLIVIDEADKLFDFTRSQLLKSLFSSKCLQSVPVLLFSSYFTNNKLQITHKFIPDLIPFFLKTDESKITFIKHFFVDFVSISESIFALTGILECGWFNRILIFVNSNEKGWYLLGTFKSLGYSIGLFSEDFEESYQEDLIEKFKNNNLSVLVTTDKFPSRINGLSVDLVINFDQVQSKTSYVSRAVFVSFSGAVLNFLINSIGQGSLIKICGKIGVALNSLKKEDFNDIFDKKMY
jgi:superfamily II DNA/RNA helicase